MPYNVFEAPILPARFVFIICAGIVLLTILRIAGVNWDQALWRFLKRFRATENESRRHIAGWYLFLGATASMIAIWIDWGIAIGWLLGWIALVWQPWRRIIL